MPRVMKDAESLEVKLRFEGDNNVKDIRPSEKYIEK